MDKDDIIKELERRIEALEGKSSNKATELPDNLIDYGDVIEDYNSDRFIKTDTDQYVFLSDGQVFEYIDLCHPLKRVSIGTTSDGGETWTEV